MEHNKIKELVDEYIEAKSIYYFNRKTKIYPPNKISYKFLGFSPFLVFTLVAVLLFFGVKSIINKQNKEVETNKDANFSKVEIYQEPDNESEIIFTNPNPNYLFIVDSTKFYYKVLHIEKGKKISGFQPKKYKIY